MRRLLRFVLGTLGLLVVFGVGGAFWLCGVLYPSSKVKVSASLDGKPLSHVAAYDVTFSPGVCYIHLPEADRVLYHWLLLRFDKYDVSSGSGPSDGPFGLLYVHRDLIRGIKLTDGKTEDNWRVNFIENAAHFSNGHLDVTVHRDL